MNKSKTELGFAFLAFLVFFLMACDGIQNKHDPENDHKISAVSVNADLNKDTIYKTENLILLKVSNHIYQHISFLSTNDFGKVDCNGMLIINDSNAIIFDTPTEDKSSEELINYVTQNLKSNIIAVISTHFHEDCIGGIEAFNHHHIPFYASNKTITELKGKRNKYASLMKGFNDSLTLDIGDKKVFAKYFGEGHTKDNIIGYFPSDSVMFGGCLIKEAGAKKGNLEDANTKAWPYTVMKLKQEYPQAKIVIPGHGKTGGRDLLDYTISLFK